MLLTIIVSLVIIAAALIGMKKGLFRAVVGTLATVIALVLCYTLTPYTSHFIIDNTQLDDYIEERTYKSIESAVQNKLKNELKGMGLTGVSDEDMKQKTKELMENDPERNDKISLIRELNAPEFIRNALLENDNSEIYEKLGVNNVYRYIAKSVALMIVNAVALIVTFVVIRILLIIFTVILNSSLKSIKLVAFVDKLGGFVAGLIIGVLIAWVIMGCAALVMGAEYDKLIEENQILMILAKKEIFTNMVANITDVIFK